MQATVGSLVAKTLTSSTSNPYAAAGQAARTTTPTALDAFSVQVRHAVWGPLRIRTAILILGYLHAIQAWDESLSQS